MKLLTLPADDSGMLGGVRVASNGRHGFTNSPPQTFVAPDAMPEQKIYPQPFARTFDVLSIGAVTPPSAAFASRTVVGGSRGSPHCGFVLFYRQYYNAFKPRSFGGGVLDGSGLSIKCYRYCQAMMREGN